MDIDKILNLKELLVDDYEKQYVIITTKRNFLNSNSSLYVQPKFIKLKEILSNIDTEQGIETIIKHLNQSEEKFKDKDYELKEHIVTGIVLERNKYDDICKLTHNRSNKEVLNTDMINESILDWTIHNIVEISPYMMDYSVKDKNNIKDSNYVIVEPTILVHFTFLCNYIRSLGYNIDVEKGTSDSLKKSIYSRKAQNPYKELCSTILDNRCIFTEGIEYNYNTDIIVSSKNKPISNALVRIRK